MRQVSWVLCLYGFFCGECLAVDFYRWVDDAGVLHFDTEKPSHTQSTKKTVDPEVKKGSFSNACQTARCQRNLEKLLEKQLLETKPHTSFAQETVLPEKIIIPPNFKLISPKKNQQHQVGAQQNSLKKQKNTDVLQQLIRNRAHY